MILDPLEIPDDLLEAQEQGLLVVFVGAGVSQGSPSDLPDFKGLACEVAKGTPFEKEASKYDQRLDRYFGEMARGEVQIQQLVRQRIGNPASLPTDLHRWILDLFFQPKDIRIVTTNFDPHFTKILAERAVSCDQYFAPALPLGHRFRGLVYLHGSILRTDDPLILSDEDFGCAYMTEGWARDFLRGMFDTYTTLFVGYSHTDPPVVYLARGMSAIGVAPRFALTSIGEQEWWHSLKVRPITFEKPAGDADFSELGRGLRAWAQFSKDQPTDIAQKVRDILRSPPEIKLEKSQSSLLMHCLGRSDECHFITSEAVGWRWVEWANEQGLLKPLFGQGSAGFNEPQGQLAMWLAKMLVAERSEKGLLLVAEHGGVPGRVLWLYICRRLWPSESPDFTSSITQKWLLLLIGSCPDMHKRDLGYLLEPVTKAAPKTLGLLLFRILTSLRVTVSRGWTFDVCSAPETLSKRPKAEFELALVGESFHLEQAWQTVFKPLIPVLGREYLRILNDRMLEMYAVVRTAQRADNRYDPWSMRGSIQDREAHRGFNANSLILDLFLDVIDEMSECSDGIPANLIDEWLAGDFPTLTRVGLLSLRLAKSRSSSQKVSRIFEGGLLYPLAYGAEHETYALLVHCYLDLTPKEREELWRQINGGPKYPRPEGVEADDFLKHTQYEIDKLTGWLATRAKDCPLAIEELKKLKHRSPEFRENDVIDRAITTGGVIDMNQSPKTAADLLSQRIESQIAFLLTYEGEPSPSGVTRAGLVAAVGDACAQNTHWAISLFEELDRRQEWDSDLWQGAFWRLRLSLVPSDKLTWLLDVLDKHFATSPQLQGLTFFIFNGVEFSDQKAPPDETLQRIIKISVHIWQQIRVVDAKKTDEFEKTEWTNHAINHPAGHIAEFWLKCWSFLRAKSGDSYSGWPEWMRGPLDDIGAGASYAAQLGRVIFGNQMPFVHTVDPAWTRGMLFPKFIFSLVGEEAFLLWEPHLKHGRLSRDLIIEMLPLYRQAFPRFRNVQNDLAVHLYKHVAIILYSCLVDVTQDGWLNDFLTGLTEEQRAKWASQMEFVLRDFPSDRKQIIWDKWMRDYWQGRLHGKPCKLATKEASEMVEWAIALEPTFAAAVGFVVQGPSVENRIGTVLFQLERGALLQTQPEAVIRLLTWLLINCHEDWPPGEEVRKMIMQLPKKKSFLQDLAIICERLASLGYTKSLDLKAEILREFTIE